MRSYARVHVWQAFGAVMKYFIVPILFWATAASGLLVRPNAATSLIWLPFVVLIAAPIVYNFARSTTRGVNRAGWKQWLSDPAVARSAGRDHHTARTPKAVTTNQLPYWVAVVVVAIGLLLVVFSGYADDWWALVVGNVTFGQKGFNLVVVVEIIAGIVLAVLIAYWLYKLISKNTTSPNLPEAAKYLGLVAAVVLTLLNPVVAFAGVSFALFELIRTIRVPASPAWTIGVAILLVTSLVLPTGLSVITNSGF